MENYVLKTISNILNEKYEIQKTWNWLVGINDYPLFCDGFYESLNLVVEADGIQHKKPVEHFGGEKTFSILQKNDSIKNNLIPKHGLKLLRIDCESDWHNPEYLKQRLIEIGIEIPNSVEEREIV